MKKKLISFSVYGNFPLYNFGALENYYEAKEYFPDWTCRFYVAKDAPILGQLQSLDDCEIVVKETPRGNYGMFWRFEAISDPNAEYILIRDVDSRLNDKDAKAVEDWIKCGTNAHRMAETHGQISNIRMLGCGIGFKGGIITNIEKLIDEWILGIKGYMAGEKKYGDRPKIIKTDDEQTRLYYGSDQIFLNQKIWPIIKDSCTTYGVEGIEFPPHKPLKWGGDEMFRRITPFTQCEQIFGDRPDAAYMAEDNY